MTHSQTTPPSTSVLFVCLGNICRSPLAEGVFRHQVQRAGLGETVRIDSAGTEGWHVGNPPDRRSIDVARAHGVALDGQRARRVSTADLEDFNLVMAMDRSNLAELTTLRDRHGGTARLALLRDFDPEPDDGEVPDPYYGGPDGFVQVFAMVDRSCARLLEYIRGNAPAPW